MANTGNNEVVQWDMNTCKSTWLGNEEFALNVGVYQRLVLSPQLL